jgi:protease I
MADQKNKKVAILTENGFEQSELVSPKEALEKAGYTVEIVSPQRGKVKAWDEDHWGIEIEVNKHVTEAVADDYAGLVLPGGVWNPDKLRTNEDALQFIKDFFESGKPIAAICHGPWTLINAGVAEGRHMTSYPSIKMDLINAGVVWVDQEVVVDNGLITSRSPKDLKAFNAKLIEELKEGAHDRSARKVVAKT